MLGSGKWKFCFSELSGIFFLKYFWSQLAECMKANCVIWFHLHEAIENTNLIYKNRKLFTCVWGYRIKKGQRLVNLGRWKCYVILIVQRLIRCMDLFIKRYTWNTCKLHLDKNGYNVLFIPTWHEHTEHRSFSSTQIWPLCLIFPSWMQSPVQFFPWGHRQSYPPSKLKQMVSLAQLCLPVPHSSISTAKKKQQAMCLEYALFQITVIRQVVSWHKVFYSKLIFVLLACISY